MVNGVEGRVGDAVGEWVDVGTISAGVALPGNPQEVSMIKVKRIKTILWCTLMSPGKGCRYFT
jgi:hypothetical protein